jgi:hypothetical protein
MTIINTTELFYTVTGSTSTRYTTSTSYISGELDLGIWSDNLLYNYNVLPISVTSSNPYISRFLAYNSGELDFQLIGQFQFADVRFQTINNPVSFAAYDLGGNPLSDGSIFINSLNAATTLLVVQPVTYLSFTPFANISGELDFNNYSNFTNNGNPVASANIYVQATYVNVSANQNALQVATNTSGYSGQQRQIWLS